MVPETEAYLLETHIFHNLKSIKSSFERNEVRKLFSSFRMLSSLNPYPMFVVLYTNLHCVVIFTFES